MNYEEALRVWGAVQLKRYASPYPGVPKSKDIVPLSVKVDMNFSEGYPCCGGRDPDCYCSLAESPSVDITISGYATNGKQYHTKLPASDFDFRGFLKELLEVSDGSITRE